MPTRSAFSSGPSTARRAPKLDLTTSSTVFGVADALGDERDRLAPERVLQPVADEAGHVLLHLDRRLADRSEQRERRIDRRVRRLAPCGSTSTNGTR